MMCVCIYVCVCVCTYVYKIISNFFSFLNWFHNRMERFFSVILTIDYTNISWWLLIENIVQRQTSKRVWEAKDMHTLNSCAYPHANKSRASTSPSRIARIPNVLFRFILESSGTVIPICITFSKSLHKYDATHTTSLL